MVPSRALTSDEQGVLRKIISAAGADALIAQIPATVVIGGPPTFLALSVADSALPADVVDGPIQGAGVSAVVHGDDGERSGEILVWVESGLLSGLEYAWWTDEPPAVFPAADRVHVQPVARGGSV